MSKPIKLEPWQEAVVARFIDDPRTLPVDVDRNTNRATSMNDGIAGETDKDSATLSPDYRHRGLM